MSRTDPRFLRSDGIEVFNGNELLVKGCLEAPGGVQLMTGYPGSPIAGFFDILGGLADLLKAKGVRAFQSNNEALAAAALNGSQMAGIRGAIAFKSVGLHVASDALALGNLGGPHPDGGAVVITGDDPWCDSTQVPADSRFLLQHLRMPVVEPGDVQELKDWVGLSFELSRRSNLFVGYVVTTSVADGGGSVVCKPNHFSDLNTRQRAALDTQLIDLEKVLLPPRTWQRELEMPARHEAALKVARELGLNRIDLPADPAGPWPLGFVVTGMAGPYLDGVLAGVGLAGHFPVLRMGMSYPADAGLLVEFGKHCGTMVVIEERRSFLEQNLRDALYRQVSREDANDVATRLFGKQFPTGPGFPETRGLNPSVLAERLLPLLQSTAAVPSNGKLSDELARLKQAQRRRLDVLGSAKVSLREPSTPAGRAYADLPKLSKALAEATSIAPNAELAANVEDPAVPARTPTFCPGCPHRDSSAVLLQLRKDLADARYMKRTHGRGPVDLVAHGDTGCYTMLMFAPTQPLMHNYSGMGLGGGTGAGIDPFITNKQLVFMGDGTFFHSGAIAISNAVKSGQDITFIILENGTTAMTGHQEHPGTERDVLGNMSWVQDIEAICRGMRGTSPLTVAKLDPSHRKRYRRTLEETILRDGVKIVIADKECGITLYRRKAKEEAVKAKSTGGFVRRKAYMNVTAEVCENCRACTQATACPGLAEVDTDYGTKIGIDLTLCVNDGACERVRVSDAEGHGHDVQPCPSFEQIIVKRRAKPRRGAIEQAAANLPTPKFAHDLSKPGSTWRAHAAGVGGTGVGTVSAIIVRAGHLAGYGVRFVEKKGLAIRNGGVYSQVTWVSGAQAPESRDLVAQLGSATTGILPYASADLLLGIDLLESARAVDPKEAFRVAAVDRTAAVVNKHMQATVNQLLGEVRPDPDALIERLAARTRPDRLFARDLSTFCEQRLGSKQYVNLMLLGVAWQRGQVPVPLDALVEAIKLTIGRRIESNLNAFNLGRKIAHEDQPEVRPAKTWQTLLGAKLPILKADRRGRAFAAEFERLVRHAVHVTPSLGDELHYDLALRVYDLVQYDGPRYAFAYLQAVRGIYRVDYPDYRYRATRALIHGLAKLMLIKDEPYVAYLLTRPEKRAADYKQFDVDLAAGDRVSYVRHNCPEVPLWGGRKLRLTLTTYDWQHRLLAKARFVRKLPGWHRRERAFLDWYKGLLPALDLSTDHGYAAAVDALESVMDVTGYREIRYPKMDAAKIAAEAALARATPGAPRPVRFDAARVPSEAREPRP